MSRPATVYLVINSADHAPRIENFIRHLYSEEEYERTTTIDRFASYTDCLRTLEDRKRLVPSEIVSECIDWRLQ